MIFLNLIPIVLFLFTLWFIEIRNSNLKKEFKEEVKLFSNDILILLFCTFRGVTNILYGFTVFAIGLSLLAWYELPEHKILKIFLVLFSCFISLFILYLEFGLSREKVSKKEG
ncbi:hypothetical protein CSB11_02160 [Candidatus Campbellbacteria bacterium]|nr:MAG: hypothetical protein CSB11_02160 [Candidatus Campbellbacteria bacterium]